MKLNVLYEDNHLVAVFKPAGVLTQGDKTGDASLMDEVKKYLKEKYRKPGNVFLGLLHRLDRPVSGIILFAKTGKGASRLSEQFRNRSVKKIYHAIVIGKPEKDKGEFVNYLKKNEEVKRAEITKEGEGQLAELIYEIIESNGKYSLLKIRIKTGRFHQIRVQLAAAGFPILGDVKYGAKSALPDRNIALSATALSFQTATTKEKKEISIPIPAEWQKYIKN
ncbi:MAG: RluA family pseudouridine synthase [Patescibacteria group bacterium]